MEQLIAGVDEVGRGCLAGPVVVAAVILPPDHGIEGLRDSKKLSAKRRDEFFQQICKVATAYSIAEVTADEIDKINILEATKLATKNSILNLSVKPHMALVDGNMKLDLGCDYESIIGGDDTIAVISAASIVAKVTRDRMLEDYEKQYPGYGFAKHKGYGTKQHIEALKSLGVTPIHRKSFAPVRRIQANPL